MRAACVAAVLGVAAAGAQANGWEHGAVPFEALVAALASDDGGVRRHAATSLGFRREARGVAPLLDALRRGEPDADAREAVFDALGTLGDARGEPPLLACTHDEPVDAVRGTCVHALGELRTPAALSRLVALSRDGTSTLVQARAVQGLGYFSDPQAVRRLAELVDAPNTPTLTPQASALRRHAVVALGRSGAAPAAEPLLRVFAHSTSSDDTVLAVRALAQLAAPAAATPLRERLAGEQDPVLRFELTTALAALPGGDVNATLMKRLQDATPAVRYAAVEGLRQRADKAAAPALAALAQRELDAVQAALGRGTSRYAIDRVAAVGHASLAAAALRGVYELDAAAGRDVLLRAARWPAAAADAPPDIANAIYQLRRTALYGLGYSGANEAAALIASRAVLGDSDPRLRAVAVRSLGVLGARAELTRQLRLLTADEAAEVRWTMAEVLGLARVREAEPALLRALADPHALVRKAAAESLGYLRAGNARARLRVLATPAEPDARVRAAAGVALQLIERPEP